MEKKLFESNSSESKRIFRSNFFEFFSKCPWYVPPIYWTVNGVLMIYFGAKYSSSDTYTVIKLFLLGLFLWSILEYLIHRFLFHWEPKSKKGIGARLHFLVHGVHHNFPQDHLRLVTPPALATIFALPVIGTYYLFTSDIWIALLIFSGTNLGFMLYDLTHYTLHHGQLRFTWFKLMKKHHLYHHYTAPEKNFGVTPLGIFWDFVFQTHK